MLISDDVHFIVNNIISDYEDENIKKKVKKDLIKMYACITEIYDEVVEEYIEFRTNNKLVN